MPAIQTTYNSDFAPGYVGLIADQGTRNVVSRVVTDVAGLQFGLPVFQGPADLTVTSTPGSAFIGITLADKTVRPSLAFADAYGFQDTAAVITLGAVWVLASTAVTAGQHVFATASGEFTGTSGAGDTAIDNAIFDTSAPAGGLVIVRLT